MNKRATSGLHVTCHVQTLPRLASQKGHEDILLAALCNIAANPSQCSSGWLGHISLDQIDHIASLFRSRERVFQSFVERTEEASWPWTQGLFIPI